MASYQIYRDRQLTYIVNFIIFERKRKYFVIDLNGGKKSFVIITLQTNFRMQSYKYKVKACHVKLIGESNQFDQICFENE